MLANVFISIKHCILHTVLNANKYIHTYAPISIDHITDQKNSNRRQLYDV